MLDFFIQGFREEGNPMPNSNPIRLNPPQNLLVGPMPKIGIRPAIDGAVNRRRFKTLS